MQQIVTSKNLAECLIADDVKFYHMLSFICLIATNSRNRARSIDTLTAPDPRFEIPILIFILRTLLYESTIGE